MASIGEQCKAAREARGLTISQVAEKTRIKPTHIEAMERDRFDVFASSLYARGFIKLYAECVGLDPKPLIEAYRTLEQPVRRPTLQADETMPSAGPRTRSPGAIFRDIQAAMLKIWNRTDRATAQYVGFGIGAILIFLLLIGGIRSGLRSCRSRAPRERFEAPRVRLDEETVFPLLEEPPAPYVDSDAFGVPEEEPAP